MLEAISEPFSNVPRAPGQRWRIGKFHAKARRLVFVSKRVGHWRERLVATSRVLGVLLTRIGVTRAWKKGLLWFVRWTESTSRQQFPAPHLRRRLPVPRSIPDALVD